MEKSLRWVTVESPRPRRGAAKAAWARAGDRVDVSRYGSQGRETGRKEEGGEEEKERDSGYGSKVIFVDNGALLQIWD